MNRLLLLLLALTTMALAQPDPPSSSEREAGFLFRQGLELYEQGQIDRATDLMKRALRLEPERLEIRPYLALALYQKEQYEAALRQLDLYLNKEPEDTKVALLRVKTLASLGNTGQASDALELLRPTLKATSWEWNNLRGFLYEQNGQPVQAESSYRLATEMSSAQEFEPRANLIALWLKQDRLEEATKLVSEMLAEASDNPQVLNAFALLLAKKDKGFDPAPILEAVKSQALPFELQYNLAAALAERDEGAQAALLAADLVDRFEDEPRAAWLYGRILLQRRELQEAGDYLTSAKDRIPTTDEVLKTLGTYSFLVGDYQEAVGWFRQAVERSAEDADAAHNLSMALSRLDKLDEAVDTSRKAVALQPEDPRFVYQLALVLDRNGKLDQASQMYRRFLELNEDPKDAAIVREHLDEIEGKK